MLPNLPRDENQLARACNNYVRVAISRSDALGLKELGLSGAVEAWSKQAHGE